MEKDDLSSASRTGRIGKERFSEAEQRAQVLGLKLEYKGIIPSDEKLHCLLNGILLEAVNNAVRHGHAAVLEVTFKETEQDWYADIRNDGIPPKETIREGGGLAGIRKRLEAVGGNLQFETNGKFVMQVNIPKRMFEEI